MEQPRRSARVSVIWSGVLYTPFFLAALAGAGVLIRSLADDFEGGTVVGVAIVGVVALLTGYQSIQALRDLFTKPVETRGVVERKWSRSDFFVARSHYVMVKRNVFHIEPFEFVEVELGDTVSVIHYPHTSTVESLTVAERGEGERGGAR
ncbi:MAG: hypothetical protein WBF37_01700 [Dehalococcoidia bacterium]